jgi:hypothetical protein
MDEHDMNQVLQALLDKYANEVIDQCIEKVKELRFFSGSQAMTADRMVMEMALLKKPVPKEGL